MNAMRRNRAGKALFWISSISAAFALFVTVTFAAPSKIEQIANYKGKDREQVLIAGAKKEGTFSLYTAMNQRDSQPLVDGFKKKYPFIKVDLFAGLGADITARLITEQKNRNFNADAFNALTINVEKIRREGLLIPYYTAAQDIFDKKYVDANRYWVPTSFYILTFVYNTNEIKDPPKTWQDLLDPKWKGKLTIEDRDEFWLINFSKLWGEAQAKDYFTRLGKQDLQVAHGHAVLMQKTITGEAQATPTQYLHQAVSDIKAGAPVSYVLMDPMLTGPDGIVLLKNAPHPHAALLFIDYVTSKEGQTLIYGRGRNVAYPGMDPLLKDVNLLIDDPSQSLDNFGYWQKLYKDLLITPNMRR